MPCMLAAARLRATSWRAGRGRCWRSWTPWQLARDPAVLEAAVRATGLGPGSLIIEQRSEGPHQTTRLDNVWADGRHLMAKEYLSNVDLDAPLNEYRALPH